MRTLIRIVHDANDDPAVLRELGRAHDPGVGVVVVRPTPGRGGAGITRDVLRALGKRFDIAGTPRSAAGLLSPAVIWLGAEHTRYLVITRAHLLDSEDWMTLLALRQAGLEELWFVVHEPALSPAQRDALAGVKFSEIEPAEAASYLPPHQAAAATTHMSESHPPVPRADFAAFLTRSAELLDTAEFQLVEQTYRRGQRVAEQWLDRRRRTTPAELHAFLGHLIEIDDEIDAALALLRGAQSRLFLAGLLVQIDVGRFSAWYDSTPRIPLSAPVSQLLRAFVSTRHAALAALSTLTRWDPARLARITIDDLDQDASELRGGHEIPEHARALVRAHLQARTIDGACGADPLFIGQESRTAASTQLLTDHLDTVAARTGLQFVSRAQLAAPTDRIASWATIIKLSDVQR